MADPTNEVHLPPAAVLDAFGVRDVAVPLAGGEGRSVRAGSFVFKPVGRAETEEVEWAAGLFECLVGQAGFRVPRPLRATDGRCVVDGWAAAELVAGETGLQGRWASALTTSRAFHTALQEVPRPAFLDRRTHPWAVGDRVAWGEQTVEVLPDLADPLAQLLALRRPVEPRGQIIHGDLTGNLLFAPGEEPAVIDFSPYWRPAVFAEAIIIADGLLWFDVPLDLVTGHDDPEWKQMLIRALIFRLVAHSEAFGPAGHAASGEPQRYQNAIAAVVDGCS
ncbi:phosphotransferase [Streptomyces sp. NPDC050743]|uniref:phosphotransferase n=1 Tax=Streptomyces sp. NPDC050743 TaxID=3365634 RepID=UPI0037B85EA9